MQNEVAELKAKLDAMEARYADIWVQVQALYDAGYANESAEVQALINVADALNDAMNDVEDDIADAI